MDNQTTYIPITTLDRVFVDCLDTGKVRLRYKKQKAKLTKKDNNTQKEKKKMIILTQISHKFKLQYKSVLYGEVDMHQLYRIKCDLGLYLY